MRYVILPAKFVNLGMLILGFGLGQGSLFVANTLLYWGGHYELVSQFGAANAFVTFAYFICDWGGLVFIAKESVIRSEQHRPIETSYLALALVRVGVAASFVTAFYVQQIGQEATFFSEYSQFAGIGLFFYAFNANGLLDGASRAGISGLTQALPIVFVALTLPLCRNFEPIVSGQLLGFVYALGMAFSVSVQILLIKFDWRKACYSLSPAVVLTVGRESLPYMLTPLPGQTMFRTQVYLATAFLPPQLSALFIYSRQIIGVSYQGLTFMLRVDLKDFAKRLVAERPTATSIVIGSATIRLGLLGSVAICMVALLISRSQPDLAYTLLIYSPCVLASSVATTLQRVFILQGRSAENVAILIFTVLLSCLVMFPFVNSQEIWPLVAIELVSQVLQSSLYAFRWKIGMGR